MNTIRVFLIILVNLLIISCIKEDINSFMLHLRNNVYLDHTTRSIRIMHKNGEDSFILGKVIISNIDSAYINKDKTIIYIINDKNEYIQIKRDFTTKKLDKKPNVTFKNIISYHD